ncbi:MAG: MvaI/BcnI restriction endonuclease family protein [Bacteroidetes bacterium]|nr:MvaI/BcnI restriction endonuclease family protein [Bacteroidota bacterium]
MMPDSNKIISEFQRIKALGFVKNKRINNKDGGIGNTFEDHLGVSENNKKDPDFEGFEVKTQREFNSSYITLFSKSPTNPDGANAILKDKFGEVRDPQFPELKKLYASIFGNKQSLIYKKYYMQLKVDRDNSLLKLKSMIVVAAEQKKIHNINFYHYKSATVYHNFVFSNFLSALEGGDIMFDIRIGVYNSGKNYGNPHDHGSGFRIKKENIAQLFETTIHIE